MLRTIKEIRAALPSANNNQRNWDLSKSIPDEHLQLFKQVVFDSPRFENNTYYNVHFILNRELIEKIYHSSTGSGPATSHPKMGGTPIDDDAKEPQLLANLLVVFENNIDHGNFIGGGADSGNTPDMTNALKVSDDRLLAMGNAAGMLVAYATQLGYKTGYNICDHNDESKWKIKHIMEISGDPYYILSIGHGNKGVDHGRDHNDKNIRYGKNRRVMPLGQIKVWE